jgi:PAS domain S-box-containing protein
MNTWPSHIFTDLLNRGGNPMNDEPEINEKLIQEQVSLKERIAALEEELRESEEKCLNILENIEDVYFEVDRAGDFTFFNPSLCRNTGYAREEMLGMNYKVLMDADNAKKILQAFSDVYVSGSPKKFFGWEVIKKDGARIHIEGMVSFIAKPGEKPTRFFCVARNITDSKRMEEDK